MKPVISCVMAICMAFFAMNAAAYNLPDTGQTIYRYDILSEL